MRMTKQEWEKLTPEEQLKLFEELEEQKEATDKALEQFLKKKRKRLDKEKWISLSGYNGGAIRVSDIVYIETTNGLTRIVTNITKDGENFSFQSDESPEEIVKKINGE